MSSSTPTAWDIYKGALYGLHYGHALWEPSPIYSYQRVKPGYVGYIRDGGFHLLFDAGAELGSGERNDSLPQNFERLEVGPIKRRTRPPGCLHTATIRQIGVGGVDPLPIVGPVEPGANMNFELTSKQGAALITDHMTYREDIERKARTESYTKKHFDSWVDFAREQEHGDDVKPILVTGVDLTKKFASIAYADIKGSLRCNFSVGSPGSAALTAWGTWYADGLVHNNCGQSLVTQGNQSRGEGTSSQPVAGADHDQCVFIRYITIRKRFLIPMVLRAGAGAHRLPEGNFRNEGAEAVVIETSDDLAEVCFLSASSIETHDAPLDNRDDFDVIAAFIFQKTDAKSVFFHDDDIKGLIRGSEEETMQFLEDSAIIERVEVDEDGVAQLLAVARTDKIEVLNPFPEDVGARVSSGRDLWEDLDLPRYTDYTTQDAPVSFSHSLTFSPVKQAGTVRKPYTGQKKAIVIALDVGTTFSGVSYALLDPGEIPKIYEVTRFPGQEHQAGNPKIPSVIWYDRHGDAVKAGAEAEEQSNVNTAEEQGWTKVELFKLRLRPKSMKLEMNGMKLPHLPKSKSALEVFGDFLKYLFRCTRSFIVETHAGGAAVWKTVENDIQFILSHPNGWEGAQQSKMRKAAIYGGLVPNTDEGKARVRFVTEGEASLHACVLNGLADNVLSSPSRHGFVVVDAGGGTLDISSYAVKGIAPLRIEEIAPPDCLFSGSVFVSRRARKFLEQKLNGSAQYGASAMLDHITKRFDETTKRLFRSRNENQYLYFGSPLDKDQSVGIRNGKLKLTGDEVADLFEPSIEAAVDSIRNQVVLSGGSVKSVWLVGGFASSPWLFTQLQERLEPDGIVVSRPDGQTSKAVANGAIGFYCDHHVGARIAKYMYGVEFLREFDAADPEHVDRQSRLFQLPSGPKLLQDAFDCILARNSRVKESTTFSRKYCTELTSLSTLAVFEIEIWCYRGPGEQPKWILRGQDDFSTLCFVRADLSPLTASAKAMTGPGGKKYWTIVFSIEIHFGLTEFKARVKWTDCGKVKYGPASIVYDESGNKELEDDRDSQDAQKPTLARARKSSGWGSWGGSLPDNFTSATANERSPSPEPAPVKLKIEDPPRGFTPNRPPESQPAGFGSANRPAWGGTKIVPPIIQKTSTGSAWGAKHTSGGFGSSGPVWGNSTEPMFAPGVGKNLTVDTSMKFPESGLNTAGPENIPESAIEIKHVPAPGLFRSSITDLKENEQPAEAQEDSWGPREESGEGKGSKKKSKETSPMEENAPEQLTPAEETQEPANTEETAIPAENGEDELDLANAGKKKKKGPAASVARTLSAPNLDPDNADHGATGGGGTAGEKGGRR